MNRKVERRGNSARCSLEWHGKANNAKYIAANLQDYF